MGAPPEGEREFHLEFAPTSVINTQTEFTELVEQSVPSGWLPTSVHIHTPVESDGKFTATVKARYTGVCSHRAPSNVGRFYCSKARGHCSKHGSGDLVWKGSSRMPEVISDNHLALAAGEEEAPPKRSKLTEAFKPRTDDDRMQMFRPDGTCIECGAPMHLWRMGRFECVRKKCGHAVSEHAALIGKRGEDGEVIGLAAAQATAALLQEKWTAESQVFVEQFWRRQDPDEQGTKFTQKQCKSCGCRSEKQAPTLCAVCGATEFEVIEA